MSFLKFHDRGDGAGGAVHWSRAKRDGAPFRGNNIPLLRDEEFEEYAERVTDTKFGIFDTNIPAQRHYGRTYQEVLDGITAGLYQLACDRQYRWATKDGNDTMLVYIEWIEPYFELPKNIANSLQSSVVPLEGETRYGQIISNPGSQPRSLRPST